MNSLSYLSRTVTVTLLLMAVSLHAQPIPQYELTIREPMLIGTTYQFDIYVKRVGSTPFRIGNSQFVLTFNAGGFTSPSISRVSASEGIGTGFFFDQVIAGSEIRISLGGNGSSAAAVDIAATGSGTRISTFQIAGVSVPLLSPDLLWVNLPALIRTGVSEIMAGDNYRDITDISGISHINGGGEFARVSGYKFNDINGDGAWNQPGEPAMDGWNIILIGSLGPDTVTTGDGSWAAGYYEFNNLTPGAYSIAEVGQNGWSPTLIPISPFQLDPDEYQQNINFGNFFGPTIQGMKFNDINGDGMKDPGEPGISGWEIVAAEVGGGGVKSSITTGSGTYVFAFTPSEAGTWMISETPRTGWMQTYPESTYTIIVGSGTYETGKDFGNFLAGSISGAKFSDFTRDSIRQPVEIGLSGWLIRLRKNGVQVDSQITDIDGHYSFGSLGVGSYEISEELQAGWAQTVPAPPGIHTAEIDTGGTVFAGLDFGNYHIVPIGGPGSISGQKYNDRTGNGTRDGSDEGIEGWTMYLRVGTTIVDSTITDADGNYTFPAVDDGIYEVAEELPSGWMRTYPPGIGLYTVTILPGDRDHPDLDFGNFKLCLLSGVVYFDVNHNGTRDAGEQGMEGMSIRASGAFTNLVTMSGTNGEWLFPPLPYDLLTISSDVPPGYHRIEPPGDTYVFELVSGTNQTDIDFGNSAALDTFKFRTISYDSFAYAHDNKGKQGKAVKRVPDKIEFCVSVPNVTGRDVNGLRVRFHIPLFTDDPRYPFVVTPEPDDILFDRGGKVADMVWFDNLDPNESVQVCGWAMKAKLQQIALFQWSVDGINLTTNQLIRRNGFSLNALRLPLPNVLNVRDEIFADEGFGTPTSGGLVVGVQRTDSAKSYGWVRMRTAKDVQKSFLTRAGVHTEIQGFEKFASKRRFVKEQKRLPPRKQNNRLFADVASLKLNIKASELQKIPPGLGELIYDEGPGNPLSGLTLREIAGRADTALTYWSYQTQSAYLNLDTTIRKITNAFEGEIDTVSFAYSLKLTGVRPLIEIFYLRAVPGVVPVRVNPGTDRTAEIPSSMELHQNYPNPFNPTTTVEFELSEASLVSLRIFNVLGQEVSRILDGVELDDGEHEIEIDGSDLPSGVYFYRLIAQPLENEEDGMVGDVYVSVKKMMLVK